MQVRPTNPTLMPSTSTLPATPGPQPVAMGGADRSVPTLEQRVALLEALVQQLASVLTVSNEGRVAKLHATTVELEAGIALKLKGGVNVVVESGVQLKLKAVGPTKINGSPVELNDGTKAVARATDIQHAMEARVVIGNPTVLA